MAISGTGSLEVPTIYKAYILGLNFRGYTPKNMALIIAVICFKIPGSSADLPGPPSHVARRPVAIAASAAAASCGKRRADA